MGDFKFVLGMQDGKKIWINMNHIVKMEKTPDGNYFIFLSNGEKYLIDLSHARLVENFFARG
ncbi:MAG: competence protein ComK [Acholeplasmatales bacterium]|nr:competence protein ComK [Acholeplasmatales bacterium]